MQKHRENLTSTCFVSPAPSRLKTAIKWLIDFIFISFHFFNEFCICKFSCINAEHVTKWCAWIVTFTFKERCIRAPDAPVTRKPHKWIQRTFALCEPSVFLKWWPPVDVPIQNLSRLLSQKWMKWKSPKMADRGTYRFHSSGLPLSASDGRNHENSPEFIVLNTCYCQRCGCGNKYNMLVSSKSMNRLDWFSSKFTLLMMSFVCTYWSWCQVQSTKVTKGLAGVYICIGNDLSPVVGKRDGQTG